MNFPTQKFIFTRFFKIFRWLLEGQINENGEYRSGFFDRGSFDEIMSGWARTVVTGRARLGIEKCYIFPPSIHFTRFFFQNLGGIPLGVIAVETRAMENILPADPANPVRLLKNLNFPAKNFISRDFF